MAAVVDDRWPREVTILRVYTICPPTFTGKSRQGDPSPRQAVIFDQAISGTATSGVGSFFRGPRTPNLGYFWGMQGRRCAGWGNARVCKFCMLYFSLDELNTDYSSFFTFIIYIIFFKYRIVGVELQPHGCATSLHPKGY